MMTATIKGSTFRVYFEAKRSVRIVVDGHSTTWGTIDDEGIKGTNLRVEVLKALNVDLWPNI